MMAAGVWSKPLQQSPSVQVPGIVPVSLENAPSSEGQHHPNWPVCTCCAAGTVCLLFVSCSCRVGSYTLSSSGQCKLLGALQSLQQLPTRSIIIWAKSAVRLETIYKVMYIAVWPCQQQGHPTGMSARMPAMCNVVHLLRHVLSSWQSPVSGAIMDHGTAHSLLTSFVVTAVSVPAFGPYAARPVHMPRPCLVVKPIHGPGRFDQQQVEHDAWVQNMDALGGLVGDRPPCMADLQAPSWLQATWHGLEECSAWLVPAGSDSCQGRGLPGWPSACGAAHDMPKALSASSIRQLTSAPHICSPV